MKNSKIAWTHHTQNFWRGCSGIGCEVRGQCYAAADALQYGWTFDIVRATSATKWAEPLSWNAEAAQAGKSMRVFCGSLCDFFDPQADGLRSAAWGIIRVCRNLTWMVLTKLPGNIPSRLPADWGDRGYPNVWLGTTVTSTKVLKRLDVLRRIPAAKRFISAEPLRGPLGDIDLSRFDLLVVGGESGPKWKEHEMDLAWAKSLRQVARRQKIRFFFKQVSARSDGRGADALGRLYREMPDGLFPWMPIEKPEPIA